MNSVEQLSSFLQRVTTDTGLTTTHIGICMALCAAWVNNGFNNPFNVSRRQLMFAAKIKSKTTYHKVISELAHLNYLQYTPSYHPTKASQVLIL